MLFKVKDGLLRRKKAALLMANGPPAFKRRPEPPRPDTPEGTKLDGEGMWEPVNGGKGESLIMGARAKQSFRGISHEGTGDGSEPFLRFVS